MSRRLSKAVCLVVGIVCAQAGVASAVVDVIYSQNFDGLTPFTGAPNTSSLGVDPIYYFSYSGNDAAANAENGGAGGLVRTEGISTGGAGGTTDIFQAFDSSNVRIAGGSNTWWYSGLGAFRWVDPAVGIAVADPSKVSWTFDMRGEGLTNTASKTLTATLAFQNMTFTGNAYAVNVPVKISDTWATYGGTLDTYIPQLVDDDWNGATPPVEGNFLIANAINFQWDVDTGDWGNDADNVLHIDNLNVTYTRPGWVGASGASWTDGGNWNDNGGAAPTSDLDFPIFGQPGTAAPVSVVLNEAVSSARIDFYGTQPYTVSGTGSLTIAGPRPAAIIADGGDVTHTIDVPVVLNKDGLFRVNYGNGEVLLAKGITGTGVLTKDRAGILSAEHVRVPTVRIQSGTLRLTGGNGDDGTSLVNAIAFTNGATETAVLDVMTSRLIVNYDGTSPRDALRTAAGAGQIVSSTGDVGKGKVVILEASDAGVTGTWAGQGVDASSVLVLYTLFGDTNIDRTVNFDDLLALAQSYGATSGKDWIHGDSNGDGAVNFDDLLSLAQNYGTSVTALQASQLGSVAGEAFVNDFAAALSLVPEPASMLAIGLGGLVMRRRR